MRLLAIIALVVVSCFVQPAKANECLQNFPESPNETPATDTILEAIDCLISQIDDLQEKLTGLEKLDSAAYIQTFNYNHLRMGIKNCSNNGRLIYCAVEIFNSSEYGDSVCLDRIIVAYGESGIILESMQNYNLTISQSAINEKWHCFDFPSKIILKLNIVWENPKSIHLSTIQLFSIPVISNEVSPKLVLNFEFRDVNILKVASGETPAQSAPVKPE